MCPPLRTPTPAWRDLTGVFPRLLLTLLLLLSLPPAVLGAMSGDDLWEVMSAQLPGVDGRVDALTQFGGKLYAGGRFRVVAGAYATGIASWDGTKWSAVAGGVDGSVGAFLSRSNELIVAGGFSSAGGVAATNIARWDGSAWSSMGSLSIRTLDEVHAIDEMNGEIFVAGSFTISGGSAANYIARWDGGAWRPVGGGVNGVVYALHHIGNLLYAGGEFTQAGLVDCHGIARWDGLAWTSLDLGVHGPGQVPGKVYALSSIGVHLDVGGDFSTVGTNPEVSGPGLAQWIDEGDVQTWGVVAGVTQPASVRALRGIADVLYVGGRFSSVGGASSQDVGILAPGGWSTLGVGVSASGPSDVAALESFNGELFCGGFFETAGGRQMQSLARWSGTDWASIGAGKNLGLNAGGWRVNATSNKVYVLSSATVAGGVTIKGMAEWTSGGWLAVSPVPGWTKSQFPYTASDERYLYASYTGLGAKPSVYRLDDKGWAAVGGLGAQGPIAISGTNLFATGTFAGFGYGVARLDGTNWVGLGTNFFNGASPGGVTAIAAVGQTVYAAGNFSAIGGNSIAYLARWTGSRWEAIGDGPPIDPVSLAGISSLAVQGSQLYLGSSRNGGTNVLHHWNGSAWSTLPGTFLRSGAVDLSALRVDGSDLYVGGSFSSIDGLVVNNIARWDGSQWHAMGSGAGAGPNDWVSDIAVTPARLYVTGGFTTAGGKASTYYAIWHKPAVVTLPALQIGTGVAGRILLTWPASSASLVLEATLSLELPSWQAVTDGIVTTGGQSSYTPPPGAPHAFFRLRIP